jgi:hypothetical protein
MNPFFQKERGFLAIRSCWKLRRMKDSEDNLSLARAVKAVDFVARNNIPAARIALPPCL